jgi:hypothetical protein
MNEMGVIAPVRKIVSVKVPIAHAFEVFTSGLTRWWPHDHGVGKKPIEKVLMEPRLGGVGSRFPKMEPRPAWLPSLSGNRRIVW